ncbi:MAG: glycosyltransferase family 39 protein [Deltaproteobacteria bacterium]|nr:glycosyltransferase family 39 protein [Deltaproteobacteria bacterium]
MIEKSAETTSTSSFNRAASWLTARGDRFWGFVVIAVGCLIYLPRLGAYPLWDPWEPHYAQVAWEMQERLTWMNPWYRGIDNWWSKPILMLWLLRGSFALFWDATADFANVEWAARIPFALAAIVGGWLQFDWVRRLYGTKIGVIAGLALLTAPQYLLIGRQVMVDTLFVETYAAGLGYLAVGLFTARPPRAAPDAAPVARLVAWWNQQWPFVAFWVLEALSVLAKGFVAPTLVVMVVAGYAIATFRWQDYAGLVEKRDWVRYLATRGMAALGIAAALFAAAYFLPGMERDRRALYQALIAAAAVLAVGFVVLHDFPVMRHALHLVTRIRASWGIPLFFAVGAPWYVYMTLMHGWPYWNEFIYYHHLGRAAGTIDKPGGTFDYFVRQLGYGLFPWSGYTAGAVFMFLGRSSSLRSIANRRNLYVLLATALPYLFFTLSGTKFAHYILPVVPLLLVMIAAALGWMSKTGEPALALAEESPGLGPVVPAVDADPQPFWARLGGRGDLFVFSAMALVLFGILAHDLVLDFRYFHRLFVYYPNRETPFEYQPFIALQLIFFPIGIVIGVGLFAKYLCRLQLSALALGAVALAAYLSIVTLPALKWSFSYKPMYYAYEKLAKPGEKIGQYNDWQQPERSVIFLFQNRCVHLRNDKLLETFLKEPGRKFVIVDRGRLADLRRVATAAGVKVYVVNDDHPYARLISDQPNDEDSRKAAKYLVTELPPTAAKIDADFEGKIKLIGWTVEPPTVKPGASATVSFFYQAGQVMDRDWQIFVHGDGPQGGSRRLHIDHYPVEGLYPTTEWQPGEIVRDTFTVDVPADYPFDYFHLWTGWYIGEQRLNISNSPPNDGQNRVRGPMVKVAIK